ncbi:synaptosomal-associated protein 29-like protein [Dinothrombium tinctorium]|uniref:Synaptosomal-associated protein 29-like protein n=1 Tax=Dinothrombium tinctorium TaxID=1965070 RepID=A0A3S3P5Z9_9ACAR|nr:synaptosomal-associated protein 29-like protein [Dinothrombium tinctorium]
MIGNSNVYNDLNDEVDDFAFLSHPQQGKSGYLLGTDRSNNCSQSTANQWEQQRKQLLEQRRAIEERTLESSKVSLGLLYDSEKVGLSTAEELIKQKEQLNGVEQKLDYVNQATRISQKHLNSMKSIFGGIRNYFSKSTDTSPNSTTAPISSLPAPTSNPSSLQQSIERMRNEMTESSAANHPALRNRSTPDFSGFMDEEREDDRDGERKINNSSDQSAYAQRSLQIEKQLDENLDEMGKGIYRLKNLAMGLNSEIEEQNRMLGRITTKAERAEDTINYQTRQMKNLLR